MPACATAGEHVHSTGGATAANATARPEGEPDESCSDTRLDVHAVRRHGDLGAREDASRERRAANESCPDTRLDVRAVRRHGDLGAREDASRERRAAALVGPREAPTPDFACSRCGSTETYGLLKQPRGPSGRTRRAPAPDGGRRSEALAAGCQTGPRLSR